MLKKCFVCIYIILYIFNLHNELFSQATSNFLYTMTDITF
jgi:hypothetical protein